MLMLYLNKIQLWIKSILCSIFSYKPFTDTHTPLYDSMIQELKVIVAEIKAVKDQLHQDKQLLEEELIKRDVIIHSMIEHLPDMLWFKDTQVSTCMQIKLSGKICYYLQIQ